MKKNLKNMNRKDTSSKHTIFKIQNILDDLGIQVSGALGDMYPETFLPSSLKTGVVSFALSAQGVSVFEFQAFSVNAKAVVIKNHMVFDTTSVFVAIVPVFVVTGTNTIFGLTK